MAKSIKSKKNLHCRKKKNAGQAHVVHGRSYPQATGSPSTTVDVLTLKRPMPSTRQSSNGALSLTKLLACMSSVPNASNVANTSGIPGLVPGAVPPGVASQLCQHPHAHPNSPPPPPVTCLQVLHRVDPQHTLNLPDLQQGAVPKGGRQRV